MQVWYKIIGERDGSVRGERDGCVSGERDGCVKLFYEVYEGKFLLYG